jgi:hypothetical protein
MTTSTSNFVIWCSPEQTFDRTRSNTLWTGRGTASPTRGDGLRDRSVLGWRAISLRRAFFGRRETERGALASPDRG